MEPDLFALGVFQNEFQPGPDVSWVQRGVFLDWRGKHPAGVYALLVRFQKGQERRWQADRADGGSRLGLGDQESVLLCAVDLLGDLQLSRFQIQVILLQGQQLSPPQAGGQLGVEEIPPHLILLDGLQKGVQLFLI